MSYCFQKMTINDLDKAACLFQEAFLMEPWNEEWSYQQAFARLDEIMSSHLSRGYVVYDHQELIGMVLGRVLPYMSRQEMIIEEVCISTHYQGQGLGTQLFDYVKRECRKEGIDSLVLNTVRGFLSDQFYYKNGFREKESIVCMQCQL